MPNVRIDPKNAEDDHGLVFWLPAEEGLPRRAARGIHGKDTVEEPDGYPVVVVSRPAEESHMVYTNPKTTDTPRPHLARWFRMRLPDKNQVLNKQQPGPEYQSHVSAGSMRVEVEPEPEHMDLALYRSVSEPTFLSTHVAQRVEARRYSVPDTALRRLCTHSGAFIRPQSDFGLAIAGRTKKVSISAEAKTVARNSVSWDVWQPIDRVLKRIAAGFEGKTMTRKIAVRRPVIQFWANSKGVMAVAIASV